MRRYTLGVSWLVLALGAGAWGQAPERRLALIIANTNYQMGRLVNAVNDARTMEAVLKDLGFSTEVVLDTTEAQMAWKIVDFVGRIGEGDAALLYYSGHGVQVSGEDYLVPTDFHGADEIDLTSDSYPLSLVFQRLEGSGAAFKLVFLDASRDNPFPRPGSELRNGPGPVDLSGRGFYIAFAASSGEEASDGKPGTNGVFTGLLAAELRATKPGEKIEDVMARVIAKMPKSQIPWIYNSLSRPWLPRGGEIPCPCAPDPVKDDRAAPPAAAR